MESVLATTSIILVNFLWDRYKIDGTLVLFINGENIDGVAIYIVVIFNCKEILKLMVENKGLKH